MASGQAALLVRPMTGSRQCHLISRRIMDKYYPRLGGDMKLSDGVEQAIHSVTLLSRLSSDAVLSAAALAEFHGVSSSYLLKHLQALSGAGIVRTLPGPKGGYRLAHPPADITLLDIVLAVEGPGPAFRCNEIRRRG